MSRAKSLISDAFILAFGTLGGRIIGILLLPLYTYSLSRAEFGTVELITTTIDLIIPIVFLSISEAVLRFAMTRGERTEDVLRTAITFVSAGSAVLVAIAALTAIWLPLPQVALAFGIIVAQGFVLVLGAWGRAIGRVGIYAVSGLTQAVSIACANVVLLWFLDLGILGFMTSILIGYVAAGCILAALLPIRASLKGSTFDRKLLRRMVLFSAPLVPNAILWWLTNISGRYFIAYTHGVDEVGLFAVASRFPALVTMVTTVFAQAWQLSANRNVDSEDQGPFYSEVFRYYAAAMVLSIASLILILKPLMRAATSPAFFMAWQAVPPLLLGAMFAAFAAFYGVIYTAAKRSTGVLKTTVAAGLGSVLLNLLLVPRFGFQGAAVAISISFLVLWALRVIDSQSLVRTTVAPKRLLPGVAILGIQISALYSIAPPLHSFGAMLATWLGLVWWFRVEIAEVRKRGVAALAKFR